jgi:putative ABC transport system substrate-binding protein
MNRRDTVLALLALGAAPLVTEAQQARVYRVGVIHVGGPYSAAVDGLRDGLKELGLEEGKQLVFHVRDTKGDLASVEASARDIERENVDLIYAVSTSVTTRVKQATKKIPIVFYAGSDPVAFGLVESFRKPGGRLTGIHGRFIDLTAKRLELLKLLVPKLRRAVAFYDPTNPSAQRSAKIARDAARQLNVELIERPVVSAEELRAGLRALRPSDADAIFYVSDAMVSSQSALIIETAKAKRLPTMFQEQWSVAQGALASYGESYYTIGRFSAKYVQQVLKGADPGNMPIEQLDRLHFVVNLKTAKALGLTIPQSVLVRADEIIR